MLHHQPWKNDCNDDYRDKNHEGSDNGMSNFNINLITTLVLLIELISCIKVNHIFNTTFLESSQHMSNYDLNFDEQDGFTAPEVAFFKEQIAAMDKDMKEYITNPKVTPIERYNFGYSD